MPHFYKKQIPSRSVFGRGKGLKNYVLYVCEAIAKRWMLSEQRVCIYRILPRHARTSPDADKRFITLGAERAAQRRDDMGKRVSRVAIEAI